MDIEDLCLPTSDFQVFDVSGHEAFMERVIFYQIKYEEGQLNFFVNY